MKKMLLASLALAGTLGAWPWSSPVKVAPSEAPVVNSMEAIPAQPRGRLMREEGIAADTYGFRSPAKARGRSPLRPRRVDGDTDSGADRSAVMLHRSKAAARGKSSLSRQVKVLPALDKTSSPRGSSPSISPRRQGKPARFV